jgi:hypothetical protein
MYFAGGESVSIQIHANKEGILGPSDLQLRCDYAPENGKPVSGSNIQAKINDAFKNIVSFEKDSNDADPIFEKSGKYLSSRANLSNPTPSRPNTVILTFNQLECKDEREYRCTVTERVDGKYETIPSHATSIVVKGKYT